MNLICSGERSKDETLAESLSEYQGVYARTKRNLGILVAVSEDSLKLNRHRLIS